MNTKHTPGPWTIHHYEWLPKGHVSIDALFHGELALVVWKMEDDEQSPECEANARLIAAAPELLEALQRCVGQLRELSFKNDRITRCLEGAHRAIAKATGSEA